MVFEAGEKNPRWTGGTSQYHNHAEMKRQRLLKLKETKGICEACGRQGKQIHHIDGDKSNHALKNLAVLCFSCHGIIDRGLGNNRKQHDSKYRRVYGMRLMDISRLLEMPTNEIRDKTATSQGRAEILSLLRDIPNADSPATAPQKRNESDSP